MSSNTLSPTALVKKIRANVSKKSAVSMKPPIVVPDATGGEAHKYMCRYVSNDFREVKHECTLRVWQRCEGKVQPGRTRDGLDSKLHNEFRLVENAQGVIEAIDIIPKSYFARKAVLPDTLEGVQDILIRVTAHTGELEVVQVPAGVTKNTIIKLLDTLDSVSSIQPGDEISGGFEVTSVSGNMVSLHYNN